MAEASKIRARKSYKKLKLIHDKIKSLTTDPIELMKIIHESYCDMSGYGTFKRLGYANESFELLMLDLYPIHFKQGEFVVSKLGVIENDSIIILQVIKNCLKNVLNFEAVVVYSTNPEIHPIGVRSDMWVTEKWKTIDPTEVEYVMVKLHS